MPRSDWRIILAIVVGLGSLAVAGGYYEIHNATRAESPYKSYQLARSPSYPLRHVAGQPKTTEYDPPCQQPETSTDSDLCAQLGAVRAADEANRLARLNIIITYILGALSVVATSVGVVLVYRSLQQTDAALRHAREAAEIENRPWLDLRLMQRKPPWRNATGGIQASYEIRAYNIGANPAFEIKYASERAPYEMAGPMSGYLPGMAIAEERAKASDYSRAVIFQQNEMFVDGYYGPDDADTVHYACVIYKFAGSVEEHVTCVAFRLSHYLNEGEPAQTMDSEPTVGPATLSSRGEAKIT